MVKVYDCFTFWNEFDILEIRLNELKDVVDQFVICESTVTHVGKPKSLYLSRRLNEFKDFNIKLLVHQGLNNPSSAWINEMGQREFLMNGLRDCIQDDIILLSDVDEIPTPTAVKNYSNFQDLILFEMTHANYFANSLQIDENGNFKPWYGTKAFRYKLINPHNTLNRLRFLGPPGDMIINAGHHLSWLGGLEAVRNKLSNFAHQEFNTAEIQDKLEYFLKENKLLWDENLKVKVVDPTTLKTMPKYMLNNLEKFSKYFVPIKAVS